MKTMLKTIYCGYERILVVSDHLSELRHISRLLEVSERQIHHADRSGYLAGQLVNDRSIDLLVIDVDSIGVDDAGYLHFLAICFLPNTPVLMVTSNMSPADQECLMSSGSPQIMRAPRTSDLLSAVSCTE